MSAESYLKTKTRAQHLGQRARSRTLLGRSLGHTEHGRHCACLEAVACPPSPIIPQVTGAPRRNARASQSEGMPLAHCGAGLVEVGRHWRSRLRPDFNWNTLPAVMMGYR